MKEKTTRKSKTRKYTPETFVAIAHPTRSQILEILTQKKQISTPELEKDLNENRYNLYHHLDVLKKVGLVDSKIIGRVKHFSLVAEIPHGPQPVHVDLKPLSAAEKQIICKAVEEIVKFSSTPIKQINCQTLHQLTLLLEYEGSSSFIFSVVSWIKLGISLEC